MVKAAHLPRCGFVVEVVVSNLQYWEPPMAAAREVRGLALVDTGASVTAIDLGRVAEPLNACPDEPFELWGMQPADRPWAHPRSGFAHGKRVELSLPGVLEKAHPVRVAAHPLPVEFVKAGGIAVLGHSILRRLDMDWRGPSLSLVLRAASGA